MGKWLQPLSKFFIYGLWVVLLSGLSSEVLSASRRSSPSIDKGNSSLGIPSSQVSPYKDSSQPMPPSHRVSAFSRTTKNISKPRPLSIHRADIKSTGKKGKLKAHILLPWLIKQNLLSQKLNTDKCLRIEEGKSPDYASPHTLQGATADQIFFVLYDPVCLGLDATPHHYKLALVIKKFRNKSGQEEEIYDLHEVQESPPVRELGPIGNTTYPTLSFSESYHTYKDSRGKDWYLAILHAARGEALWALYLNYLSSLEGEEASLPLLSNVSRIYKTFGRLLANFHLKFMNDPRCPFVPPYTGEELHQCRTIIQGDLNPKNVYAHNEHITFIDNASMAKSLTAPQLVASDVAYPYVMLALWDCALNLAPHQKSHKRRYYDSMLTAFLEGYLGEYEKRNPKMIGVFAQYLLGEMYHILSALMMSNSLETSSLYLQPMKGAFSPFIIGKVNSPKAASKKT